MQPSPRVHDTGPNLTRQPAPSVLPDFGAVLIALVPTVADSTPHPDGAPDVPTTGGTESATVQVWPEGTVEVVPDSHTLHERRDQRNLTMRVNGPAAPLTQEVIDYHALHGMETETIPTNRLSIHPDYRFTDRSRRLAATWSSTSRDLTAFVP